MRLHVVKFFIRSLGLAKCSGFVSLALEHQAKGGSLLDEMPLEGRSRMAQRWQVCTKPQPTLGGEVLF